MDDSYLDESNSTQSNSFSFSDEEDEDMDRNGGNMGDDESIDTLYKAMDIAVPLPPSPLPRESSSPPPPFIGVADHSPRTVLNSQQVGAAGAVGTEKANDEEDERPFIWVLLEFYRKRNWKKKLLT